jgi:hypothetical protein
MLTHPVHEALEDKFTPSGKALEFTGLIGWQAVSSSQRVVGCSEPNFSYGIFRRPGNILTRTPER